MSWLAYALISAAAAAATAILAKVGVEGVPSSLAMAIRTIVVTLMAWAIVLGLNEQRLLPTLTSRTLTFLALSGLATGLSWWAYFRALQMAPVSWVAPIDKLSLPLTIALGALVLQESVSWRAMVGVGMIVAGAVLTRY